MLHAESLKTRDATKKPKRFVWFPVMETLLEALNHVRLGETARQSKVDSIAVSVAVEIEQQLG